MNSNKTSLILATIFLFGIVSSSFAQYDDIYYNPDTDSDYYTTSSSTYDDEFDEYEEYTGDNYDGGDSYYRDDRNSGYYYSSRIRRFNQPNRGFGYYDPVYTDVYNYDGYNSYYDPFFSRPSIYVSFGNRYNRYNRLNRWNRYYGNSNYNNDYYGGYSPYSYGGGNYGGGYGNPYNSFYNNAYCPPSYWGGNGYASNNIQNANTTTVTNTYYGSRKGGSVKASGTKPVRQQFFARPNSSNTVAITKTRTSTGGTTTKAVRSTSRNQTAISRSTTRSKATRGSNSKSNSATRSSSRRNSTRSSSTKPSRNSNYSRSRGSSTRSSSRPSRGSSIRNSGSSRSRGSNTRSSSRSSSRSNGIRRDRKSVV